MRKFFASEAFQTQIKRIKDLKKVGLELKKVDWLHAVLATICIICSIYVVGFLLLNLFFKGLLSL
jgi:hypothetical protein